MAKNPSLIHFFRIMGFLRGYVRPKTWKLVLYGETRLFLETAKNNGTGRNEPFDVSLFRGISPKATERKTFHATFLHLRRGFCGIIVRIGYFDAGHDICAL